MTKALISNISNQLLEQDRSYREYLSKLDDVYTAYQARTSWQKLVQDFFSKSTTNSRAFIVLHGLDQMDHGELDDVLEAYGDSPPNLSFLFLSDYGVEDSMGRCLREMPPHIDMIPDKTKANVDAYITYSIRDLNRIHYLRSYKRLRNQTIGALQENANGSFLWVDDMIERLDKLVDRNVILGCLANAPTSWRDAFRAILLREAGNLEDRVEMLNVSIFVNNNSGERV